MTLHTVRFFNNMVVNVRKCLRQNVKFFICKSLWKEAFANEYMLMCFIILLLVGDTDPIIKDTSVQLIKTFIINYHKKSSAK